MNTPNDFLLCKTPDAWIERATHNVSTLLIDHAHCEKKAASSAMHLIHQYGQHEVLALQLSKLAREELLHFEMVLKLLKKKAIDFVPLKSCQYAEKLKNGMRSHNQHDHLVDTLLINAIIEARSCERFKAVAPVLEKTISDFYLKLYHSEERHFLTYLALAEQFSEKALSSRIHYFLEIEQNVILGKEECFRFHSGA